MTTYPISKIRSGEVAVLLTDIEQFKKIAPEQNNVISNEDFIQGCYHLFTNSYRFTWIANDYVNSPACEKILIDFHQIDWEEGKEEVEQINPLEDKISELLTEISSLKAENERLKGENTELVNTVINLRKNYDEHLKYACELELKLRDSSKTSQNQELSLRQRMAWEYLKENPQVGVEKSFKYIDNFLNYKGGENE